MARTVTNNYKADGPPPVSGGSVADSTWFAYADNDNDPFSREQDLYYLALALERHDHRNGRGLSVGRVDAGAVDASALGPNSVGSAAIADGAVGTSELADNAVTTAKILNGTILNADLAAGVAVANLGYTPINKAGDSEIGSLVLGKVGPPAVASTLTLLGTSTLQFGQGAITGNGTIAIARTVAGTPADFRTPGGDTIALLVYNSDADSKNTGYGLGILNKAANGYDVLISHPQAVFSIPVIVSVPQGTAPISVTSTTICPNLNAQYLNNQPSSYYAPATNQVPTLLHAFVQTAASIPSGWARQTNADGRLVVGAGTSSVGGISFGENAHQGSSWSAGAGSHTHTVPAHHHFMSNVPNATGAPGPAGQYVALGINTFDEGPWATDAVGSSATWNFPTYGMVLIYKQ